MMMSSEKKREGTVLRLLKKVSRTKLAGQTIAELERLMTTLNLNENDLLQLYLESKNVANRDSFAKSPFERRIILLPQCLRPRDCPAKRGVYGYECEMCGKCLLQNVIEEGEKLGYRTFILPGGTIVEKILKDFKPQACIGVACLKELVLGTFASEAHGVIPLTVPLLRDGCVDTDVDWSVIEEAVHLNSKRRLN